MENTKTTEEVKCNHRNIQKTQIRSSGFKATQKKTQLVEYDTTFAVS